MIQLLRDPDIGTDADDALALAYLLAQTECDLPEITTVTGEASKRALVPGVLCKAAGQDVPIFPGAETTLKVSRGKRWPNRPRPSLMATSREVSTGPKTARCHRSRPGAPGQSYYGAEERTGEVAVAAPGR